MAKRKLKDFCSSKGFKQRRKGLQEQENLKRKQNYCVLFTLAAIIFMFLSAQHLERAVNAQRVAEDYHEYLEVNDVKAYDTCHFPYFKRDPRVDESDFKQLLSKNDTWCLDYPDDCKRGTQWSQVFLLNAVCLALTSLNFVLLVFGAFYYGARYIGTFCNCCLGCLHCLAFSATLGVRSNAFNRLCSLNIAPSTYEGDGKWSDNSTYQSDGTLLLVLGLT